MQALETLKEQLGRTQDKISVIASVPPNHIYTQAFSLPFLKESNLKEAALLNLQMLSPVDVNHNSAVKSLTQNLLKRRPRLERGAA